MAGLNILQSQEITRKNKNDCLLKHIFSVSIKIYLKVKQNGDNLLFTVLFQISPKNIKNPSTCQNLRFILISSFISSFFFLFKFLSNTTTKNNILNLISVLPLLHFHLPYLKKAFQNREKECRTLRSYEF